MPTLADCIRLHEEAQRAKSGAPAQPYRSARGARIAASRFGCTVDEVRLHEARGERRCPRCREWRLTLAGPYCPPCGRAYRQTLAQAAPMYCPRWQLGPEHPDVRRR